MNRCVEPELLDELPPIDPRAVGSRRDLRRLNAWMGNVQTAVRALCLAFPKEPPRCLADLGAGDGTFLLRVARRLPRRWQAVRVVLLDRQNTVRPETHEGFERLGWQPEVVELDVLDWLRSPGAPACDGLIANLFLHHFPEPQLAELLARAAERTRLLVAVEPRRSAWAFAFSRLIWLIGCNAVTRHDAPVSVRAGFSGCELSRLWPSTGAWALREGPAGLFSHLFVAWKSDLSPADGRAGSPLRAERASWVHGGVQRTVRPTPSRNDGGLLWKSSL